MTRSRGCSPIPTPKRVLPERAEDITRHADLTALAQSFYDKALSAGGGASAQVEHYSPLVEKDSGANRENVDRLLKIARRERTRAVLGRTANALMEAEQWQALFDLCEHYLALDRGI